MYVYGIVSSRVRERRVCYCESCSVSVHLQRTRTLHSTHTKDELMYITTKVFNKNVMIIVEII